MTLVITKSKALKRVCFRNFEDFMLVTWGFVVSMEGLTQIRVNTQDNLTGHWARYCPEFLEKNSRVIFSIFAGQGSDPLTPS